MTRLNIICFDQDLRTRGEAYRDRYMCLILSASDRSIQTLNSLNYKNSCPSGSRTVLVWDVLTGMFCFNNKKGYNGTVAAWTTAVQRIRPAPWRAERQISAQNTSKAATPQNRLRHTVQHSNFNNSDNRNHKCSPDTNHNRRKTRTTAVLLITDTAVFGSGATRTRCLRGRSHAITRPSLT